MATAITIKPVSSFGIIDGDDPAVMEDELRPPAAAVDVNWLTPADRVFRPSHLRRPRQTFSRSLARIGAIAATVSLCACAGLYTANVSVAWSFVCFVSSTILAIQAHSTGVEGRLPTLPQWVGLLIALGWLAAWWAACLAGWLAGLGGRMVSNGCSDEAVAAMAMVTAPPKTEDDCSSSATEQCAIAICS